MPDNGRIVNNTYQEQAKMFKNGVQTATSYVQNAIENVAESTQDATQNLVNNVMKRRRDKE
ncbi:hypothetical protein WQ54_25705 [Bacillus sp. SA1-12]|uniref:hypothetical protein n=1 Tax=Bacillus sp. SA1-12 TaxID=1455638 RepID=UPI0006270A40|nr:hypothetical protein [Bacillus sp. SA1-12]KKI89742.1 hypothetical protein WQ54_25705 [Bacillus sp. SA1-12]